MCVRDLLDLYHVPLQNSKDWDTFSVCWVIYGVFILHRSPTRTMGSLMHVCTRDLLDLYHVQISKEWDTFSVCWIIVGVSILRQTLTRTMGSLMHACVTVTHIMFHFKIPKTGTHLVCTGLCLAFPYSIEL